MLVEVLILASRTRLVFKGPNGSGVAEGCLKSFSTLESCWGFLLRRNVFEASCGLYRLDMYRSGEADGVRYPSLALVSLLDIRGPSSSVAKVGLNVNNGIGFRGKGEGSTSSLVRVSVDEVLPSHSETGGDG